jgi:hypothetical protein
MIKATYDDIVLPRILRCFVLVKNQFLKWQEGKIPLA